MQMLVRRDRQVSIGHRYEADTVLEAFAAVRDNNA
jgi:hypothetical protein